MAVLRGVNEVAGEIRALKIQGARRIARAALQALVHAARSSQAKTTGEMYDELLAAARVLEATRPTEPMMRNALEDVLRYTLAWVRAHPSKEAKALAEALAAHEKKLLGLMAAASQKIAKIGAAEIGEGAHVMIHCHSTTLMGVLLEAQKQGKHMQVTCLETRPLFQGRLSARELADAGVDVELAVDSAAGSLMNRMDLVLVGADCITVEGDLVNKVGTSTLARLAFDHSVRFLCAAELFKYDPLTRWGRAEPIEQRDPKEVWGDGRYANESAASGGADAPVPVPSGMRILNPAFDRTPASHIAAYITEEGLVPPAQLAWLAERRLESSR